jgi:hypothetical protein
MKLQLPSPNSKSRKYNSQKADNEEEPARGNEAIESSGKPTQAAVVSDRITRRMG